MGGCPDFSQGEYMKGIVKRHRKTGIGGRKMGKKRKSNQGEKIGTAKKFSRAGAWGN